MSYQLLLADETRLDIFEDFLWYEEQRNGLGLDFELCLEAGLHKVARNPHAFQLYDSIRVHFINRSPYGIHYLIEDNLIRDLEYSINIKVLHTGQIDSSK